MKLLNKLRRFFSTETYVSPGKTDHIMYMIILSFLLLFPFFVGFQPKKDSSTLEIFGKKIPGTCMSKELFETDCPGCGISRSFVLLTHGHIREAHGFHRLSLVLYLFFIFLLGYRIYCLFNPGKKNPKLLAELLFYIPLTMISLLILNWIVGLFLGGNGFS